MRASSFWHNNASNDLHRFYLSFRSTRTRRVRVCAGQAITDNPIRIGCKTGIEGEIYSDPHLESRKQQQDTTPCEGSASLDVC